MNLLVIYKVKLISKKNGVNKLNKFEMIQNKNY